jgi:hypothetical protein
VNIKYKNYNVIKGYMKIHKTARSILIIILSSILIVLIGLASYFYAIPEKDLINKNEIPKTFFIDAKNRIDIQPNNYECAAFSSAYILRNFGVEADGNELYKTYTHKYPDGTISPKGITTFFKKRGYDAVFYKGNIDTLKKRIYCGIPVIAFIKVFPSKSYLHFVPIVGYDQEYLYLSDSLKYNINCNTENYNRKISINDFETIWRTGMPFYKNTYIVISN